MKERRSLISPSNFGMGKFPGKGLRLKADLVLGLLLAIVLMASYAAPCQAQQAQAKSVDDQIQALKDKDAKIRGEAAWSLGKSGDPKAIDSLIQSLKDSDSNVREWAVLALVKMGKPSVDPLIMALKNNTTADSFNDSVVRWQSAAALGMIKDASAVEPLIQGLKDRDNDTRYWAAIALGQINDSRAREPLVQALSDGNCSVREGSGWALLAMQGPMAADLFIQILTTTDKKSSARRGAAAALGRSGDSRAAELLIQALADDDKGVGAEAARVLGRLNDSKAIEPLIKTFKDNDTALKAEAVKALVAIGRPSIGPLIETLKDEDGMSRQEAAAALGGIGDPGAVEPLVSAFQAGDSDVRRATVNALVKINSNSTMDSFLQILKDQNQSGEIRVDAAWALGELGDVRAIEPMMQVLADSKESKLQLSISRALTKIRIMR
jgi:HEAT repeat protein